MRRLEGLSWIGWARLDVICFFFSSRRRHTRFDCDWSSDVCSSDLCSGLKTETEVFELQEGGENSLVRKLIGQSRASNIVLTSGFVNAAALSDWREQVDRKSVV